MQTKFQTWMEVGTNIIIGGVIAGLITFAILHLNLSKSATALWSTIACTVWSIIRQYVIRRYFNKLSSKGKSHVRCKNCGTQTDGY